MTGQNSEEHLDIALLPLADGRRVVLPLELLAEVRVLEQEPESPPQELSWRGHALSLDSLEGFCGLPVLQPEQWKSVAVCRAAAYCDPAFRALAFDGIGEHRRVSAADLEELDGATWFSEFERLYASA